MKRRMIVSVAVLPLLLAGCGSQAVRTADQESSGHSAVGTHTMPDGTTMSDAEMKDMGSSASKPSSTASMICGSEIQKAVQHTFELSSRPVGLHSFSDHLFRCTYQLPGGDLRMSVKDLDTAGPGRAYFDGLRDQLPGATKITGLENFGFPAFETVRGDVVFIKDDKTLWVDASRVAAADLPAGFSREEAAYGVAAAVIGCWTE